MLEDAKIFLFLVPERTEFWGHLIHSVSSGIKFWLVKKTF